MPFRQVASDALADWRIAERDMALEPDGSAAWHDAALRAAHARTRYQQAIEDARAAHTPEPPPFDEASAEAIS